MPQADFNIDNIAVEFKRFKGEIYESRGLEERSCIEVHFARTQLNDIERLIRGVSGKLPQAPEFV